MFKVSLFKKHLAGGSVSLGLTARTNQKEPEESRQLQDGERTRERAADSNSPERTKEVGRRLSVPQKPLTVTSSLAHKHM